MLQQVIKFYHLNPKVDDIPDTYGKVCNGVRTPGPGNCRDWRRRMCMSGTCNAETYYQQSGTEKRGCSNS